MFVYLNLAPPALMAVIGIYVDSFKINAFIVWLQFFDGVL